MKSDNLLYRKWSIYSTMNNPLVRSKLYKGDSYEVNNEVEELLVLSGIITLVRKRNNS